MSADRESTRIVRSWLDEGVTTLPDRILDQVLDQLPATPQRRPWWQAWRKHLMNNTLKLAMAAGVFLLAVAIGFGLYFGPRQNVAAPPPEASPTTSPAADAPSPAPAASSPDASPEPDASPMSFLQVSDGGEVAAGTYVTDNFPVRVTFTVPDGWKKWMAASDATGVFRLGYEEANAGFGLWIVDEVYRDPCNPRLGGRSNPGPAVDHLALAFRDMSGYRRSDATDVTLAGFSGKYIELTGPEDLSTCNNGEPLLWTTPRGGIRGPFGANEHERLWILDVDGTRLVLMAAANDRATDADRDELTQIVESISIESRPSAQASPSVLTPLTPTTRLDAGTYVVVSEEFPARVTFTVPSGWTNWGVTRDWIGVLKDGGSPPKGAGFGFFVVDNVYLDACHTDRGRLEPPVGSSTDDLASALAELPGVESTAPRDVTFAGRDGKYLELNAPDTLLGCSNPRFWSTAYSGRDIFGPSEIDRVWILDVEGTRVVFNVMYYPETPAEDMAELESIIESVQIQRQIRRP